MRARCGLRVVLHRKGSPLNQFDALDDAVVGAGMADHCAAERRVELLARLAFEGEAVVLCGDGDASSAMQSCQFS